MLTCCRAVIQAQRDAREKQFRQNRFAAHCGSSKEIACHSREPARLEESASIKEHQRLIQVDERGPNLIFVADKLFSCLGKQLQPLKNLPLLAGGNGGEGQRLGSFVAKPELLKGFVSGRRKFGRFCAQVEFEIDLSKIEIAQRHLVRIACFLCVGGGIAKHLDRASILAAKKMEISDVVICISNENRHAFLFAVLAGLLMEFQ